MAFSTLSYDRKRCSPVTRRAYCARNTSFLARGNRVRRCQRCLLPEIMSLFDNYPSTSKSHFCLLMFDTEPMKPSNTGRLIADILPDTVAFQWSRTEPSQDLLDLVQNPDYQPMVVFPLRMLMSNGK